MKLGEILFIIVPYDKNFSKITYNSLKRHPELSLIQTYGFYIFNDENKDEWNVYDNKYLNILHICEKYKKYYDIAIVMSGDIFFHSKSIFSFISLIETLQDFFIKNTDILIAGFPYLNDSFTIKNINDFDTDKIVNFSHEYLSIKNVIKNEFQFMIDFDFCFVNMHCLSDTISILDFINNYKIDYKFEQHLLNILLNQNTYTIDKSVNLYFTEKIYKQDLRNKLLKNKNIKKDVYKFTDGFFPLPKLKHDSDINMINYYIFNKLYEVYLELDKTKLDDELSYYIEDTYLKTKFVDNFAKIEE